MTPSNARQPAAQSQATATARSSRVTWRTVTVASLLAAYVVLTASIMVHTPVLDLDQWVLDQHLTAHHPGWFGFLNRYVHLGLRRPVTQVAVPVLFLIGWRQRSPRPLIMLVLALLTLNLSVGVVKLFTGREGPRSHQPVDRLFAGGDIFPSGHVSNAVVTYGLLAMVVAAGPLRKALIALAAFISVTVGGATLYLSTHWFSDVVGGWLAGGLVLCALPWLTPRAERIVARSWSTRRAVVSLAGGAFPLYVGLNWVAPAIGGWLMIALALAILPWVTPPLERRLRELRSPAAVRPAVAADDLVGEPQYVEAGAAH